MDKALEVMKSWDIDKMVQAVVLDDPDIDAEQLRTALNEAKSGKWGRVHRPVYSSIIETRKQWGLSQSKFAEKLGISVSTLRSWENGNRKPSGAAAVLLNLLHNRPELINDLQHI